MLQLAVFQHSRRQCPGKFLFEAASENNAALKIIEIWHQAIPELSAYAGLILLGCASKTDHEEKCSFLDGEKTAIRSWLQGNKPCMGIGSGYQLLAEILGGSIGTNHCDSIGFIEGHLTSNGRTHPVFSGIDKHLPLFKWHRHTILPPVPRHFQILATSKECQIEAFSISNRPYLIGVQFDNHAAAPEDVIQRMENDAGWLHSTKGKNIVTEQIVSDSKRLEKVLGSHFRKFFGNFIKICIKQI